MKYLLVSVFMVLQLLGCGNEKTPSNLEQNQSSPERRSVNSKFTLRNDGFPLFVREGRLDINKKDSLPATVQLESDELANISFDRCIVTVEVTQGSRLTYSVVWNGKILEHTSSYLEIELPWEDVKRVLETEAYPKAPDEYLSVAIELHRTDSNRVQGVISLPISR